MGRAKLEIHMNKFSFQEDESGDALDEEESEKQIVYVCVFLCG